MILLGVVDKGWAFGFDTVNSTRGQDIKGLFTYTLLYTPPILKNCSTMCVPLISLTVPPSFCVWWLGIRLRSINWIELSWKVCKGVSLPLYIRAYSYNITTHNSWPLWVRSECVLCYNSTDTGRVSLTVSIKSVFIICICKVYVWLNLI